MVTNALLIQNLSSRRSVARLQLMDKLQTPTPADITPAPVNIWRILLGDDPTLQADTLALYDTLSERMGRAAFGKWLVMEYPWLERDCTPLIRVWWVLARKADALAAVSAPGGSV